ncbi:hypothetical protein BDV3_000180 [Batrachochytrium dendrobatidis]|nr:hypothetical protein O5D80_004473 [Batrachochytrium dendrobatidis]KAK5668041.1 hypothetical protein QVD99_005083 [Batrachochytrium dendrobatidis]
MNRNSGSTGLGSINAEGSRANEPNISASGAGFAVDGGQTVMPLPTTIGSSSFCQTGGEAGLTNTFKTAANSVALFYREALAQNKRSFESGYNQCLQDLTEFVTQLHHQQLSSHASKYPPNYSVFLADLMVFMQSRQAQHQSAVGMQPLAHTNQPCSNTAFVQTPSMSQLPCATSTSSSLDTPEYSTSTSLFDGNDKRASFSDTHDSASNTAPDAESLDLQSRQPHSYHHHIQQRLIHQPWLPQTSAINTPGNMSINAPSVSFFAPSLPSLPSSLFPDTCYDNRLTDLHKRRWGYDGDIDVIGRSVASDDYANPDNAGKRFRLRRDERMSDD